MNIKTVAGTGGHYSINTGSNGMDVLMHYFPDGIADEMNFCLFSTSGVHGTYATIEDVGHGEGGSVTFLIVQPRVVAMTYGNVEPESKEDFEFLKKLRKSSKEVVFNVIGAGE